MPIDPASRRPARSPAACGRWIVVGSLLIAIAQLFAADPDRQQRPDSAPPLKQIGPGRFELGEVRLDKTTGQIEFPAAVNMHAGVVEYFLVTTNGKVHESVLSTAVDPYRIHLAMLLMGVNRNRTHALEKSDSIAGDPVWIQVRLSETNRPALAEDLVFNLQEKGTMTRGEWTYNGSKTIQGKFAAQTEGSIVSIIRDELALINNPRPGNENDEIWMVQSNRVPKIGTPVTVILRLATNGPPAKQP